MIKNYYYKEIKTPVGKLKLIASDDGLAAILWENDNPKRVQLSPQLADRDNKFISQTEKELAEYFKGTRNTFDVKLDFKGTEFQKQVWSALLKIPYGQTRTYGEIAKQIKRPKASRAVGAANGKNPISIIAACHRVIGANGNLTGFAGGIETKAYLLKHESTRNT